MSLKQTFELLSGAKVATDCFNKSRSWLHQRINNDLVNGKPVEFTQDQKLQLAAYLRVKAKVLVETAKVLEE
jgi:hypothetical protein